jgi:hypothetical protein
VLVSEIVQLLNAHPHFPILYACYPIDTRLSAYRSEDRWAILIELVEFDQRQSGHSCCVTYLHKFGDDSVPSTGDGFSCLFVTSDGPSGPLFVDESDWGGQYVSSSATDMRIRDKVVPITTDPGEYLAAGIELQRPPRIRGHELLRLIVARHRRAFFATEAEIEESTGEPMPLLLRLDEWFHPDGIEICSPGQCETFQMIAEVIAHDDPSLYQPTVRPNTHWSNWPNAGSI